MIEVSDELKEAFINKDDIRLIINVSDGTRLTNDDFVASSMSLEQTLCEEEQITFGSVGSACFSIQIINRGKRYIGMVLRPVMYAGENYSVPLGKFTVTDDERTDDREFRNIKAYDDVSLNYDIDVSSWYNGLNYPITIKSMRDSLFNYVGIAQEPVELVNDGITVEQTIDTTEHALTFKDMVFYICEINAALGCITQNNQFRYVTPDVFNDGLYPRNDLYPANDLYPKDDHVSVSTPVSGSNSLVQLGTYAYKEYKVERCTAVTIKESDADYGTTYGDGTNVYEIVGNILCMGNGADKNRQIASNFFAIISGVYYSPTVVSMVCGMPWVELGDYVRVVGLNSASVFPILHRVFTGIKNSADRYEANGQEQYHTDKNNTNSVLMQLRSKTLKLTVSIDEVSSELTEEVRRATGEETRLSSRITQTVEKIETEVTRATTAEGTLSSRITQTADAITSEVTRASQAEGNLSSRITQNANEISTRVEKNGVISAINQSAEAISINANRINLNGAVTANNNITFTTNGNIIARDGAITTGNIQTYGTISLIRDGGGSILNWYKLKLISGNTILLDPGKDDGESYDYGITVKNTDNYFSFMNPGTVGVGDSRGQRGRMNVEEIWTAGQMNCSSLVSYGNIDCRSLSGFNYKARVIDTKDYDRRLLYCLEAPTPIFSDIGEGIIDDTGKCFVFLDDTFAETIDLNTQYQVMLQAYGDGKCYVSERTKNYFVVNGTENLKFGWTLYCTQINCVNMRLDRYEDIMNNPDDTTDSDIFDLLNQLEEEVYVEV